MELEKIRNLGDNELAVEANKAAEQLFRLRFQLTLGQTDAIKKVRLLRKDIARLKTIVRERELGCMGPSTRRTWSRLRSRRRRPRQPRKRRL